MSFVEQIFGHKENEETFDDADRQRIPIDSFR